MACCWYEVGSGETRLSMWSMQIALVVCQSPARTLQARSNLKTSLTCKTATKHQFPRLSKAQDSPIKHGNRLQPSAYSGCTRLPQGLFCGLDFSWLVELPYRPSTESFWLYLAPKASIYDSKYLGLHHGRNDAAKVLIYLWLGTYNRTSHYRHH